MRHIKTINELFDVAREADVTDFRWRFRSDALLSASMWIKGVGNNDYFFSIAIDDGAIRISFSADESEDFAELTGHGDVLKILSVIPVAFDTFKAAAEAEGYSDVMVKEMMVEPSKSKEKEEYGSTPALDTARGRIYAKVLEKLLRKYKYTFVDYQDALVYEFDEPIPLSAFNFN